MRKLLLAGAAVTTLSVSTITTASAYTVVKDWSKPGESIPVQQIIAGDGSQKCWLGFNGTNGVMFSLDFFQNGGVTFRLISSNQTEPWTSGGQIQMKFDDGTAYNANATLDSTGRVLSAVIKDEGDGKDFLHALWNGRSFHATAGKSEVDFLLTGSATALLHMHQCRYEIAPQVETALALPPQELTPTSKVPCAPGWYLNAAGACTAPQTTTPIAPTQPVPAFVPPTAKTTPALPEFHPAPATVQEASSGTVHLEVRNGSYLVHTVVNNAFRVRFQVDTGASLVNIPQDLADALMKQGSLTTADFKGSQPFFMADGRKEYNNMYVLHSIEIEGVVAHDVLCSVSQVGGSLLLGKSFFDKFGGFSINTNNSTLTLNSLT